MSQGRGVLPEASVKGKPRHRSVNGAFRSARVVERGGGNKFRAGKEFEDLLSQCPK